MATYTIEVKTGNVTKGGTDAAVFLQLIGARATSDEHQLKPVPGQRDPFEKGQLDRFRLEIDDVGWIDAIRLFHNNAKKRPGWFVESVKVTIEDLALTFQAEFNRWLAEDEDDGATDVTREVPVGNVSVARGDLASYYLGYNVVRRTNSTANPVHFRETFDFQHKQGLEVKFGAAVALTAGAELEAEFFGNKAKASTAIELSVSNELNTTTEETLTATSEYEFELAPNQALTAIALYYQNVLEGTATVGGIRLSFEDRFTIDSDILLFEGALADGDVTERLRAALGTLTDTGNGFPVAGPVLLRKSPANADRTTNAQLRPKLEEKSVEQSLMGKLLREVPLKFEKIAPVPRRRAAIPPNPSSAVVG
jgi:PLAT/LH2 domain-containing protein